MSGNGNRELNESCNGALDHILVELDIACHNADGTKSNSALRERAVRNGAGRVSRGRADGEGRTVNVMQNNLSRQGLEIRGSSRCRGGRVSGRREYGGERAEAGTGMNRNKP
jgi:hypothetical protein